MIIPEVTFLTSEHVGCMKMELWVVPCPIKKIEHTWFSFFKIFNAVDGGVGWGGGIVIMLMVG